MTKRQISEEEEDLLRDTTESPFDTGSIYSSPSMLSIHSEVGTSKHEDDVSNSCSKSHDYHMTCLSRRSRPLDLLLKRRLMAVSPWQPTTGTLLLVVDTCFLPSQF